MLQDNEFRNLTNQCASAYIYHKPEANSLAEALIPQLDFSQKRDQEALIQIVGNAVVHNTEYVIFDYLKAAGFDFFMMFERGTTLIQFLMKQPKCAADAALAEKLNGLDVGINVDAMAAAEQLYTFFKKYPNVYMPWWETDGQFYSSDCKLATEEQITLVNGLCAKLDANTVNAIDSQGFSLLHYIVWHNFYEAAKRFLSIGADVNIRTVECKNSTTYLNMAGSAPLHIACYLANRKMVKLLLENGADINAEDNLARIPLQYLLSVRGEKMIDASYSQWHTFDQRNDIFPLLVSGDTHCDVNHQDCAGNTPLLTLAYCSATKVSQYLIKPLLSAGADPSIKNAKGDAPLLIFAQNGATTAVLELCSNKALLEDKNADGNTPLHLALKNGKTSIGYLLIEAGADVDASNNNGETCRSLIENGWDEKLKKRLAGKRSITADDKIRMIQNVFFSSGSNDTEDDNIGFANYLIDDVLKNIDEDDDDEVAQLFELFECTQQEEPSILIAKAVHKAGFDFTTNFTYRSELSTLRDFILKPCRGIALVKTLSELGVDLDTAYKKGRTPVNIIAGTPDFPKPMFRNVTEPDYGTCAEYFSTESMEELNSEGVSAMHLAARFNHDIMLKTMLEKGADVNITEDAPGISGATPLHEACIKGSVEAAAVLKNAGADDSLTTQDGETPAHLLSRKSDFRDVPVEKRCGILKLLSNVDSQRNDGRTPLMLVQSLDNYTSITDMSLLLLDKGADVNKADNAGNTALLLHIYHHCNKDVVKEMIAAGADVNAKNKNGDTPLHMALRYGYDMVARLLIKKGADYQTANEKGETPMDIAVAKGMETVLELMV